MLWYNMLMKAIYQIKNTKTNKIYIGSAVDVNNRWIRHRSDLILGRHHSIHLQRAWEKYGEESFEFSIIEEVSESEQLIVREQYFIDLNKSANPDFGYNISPTAGSSLGVKHSDETRQKFSEVQKERYKDDEQRKLTGEKSRLAWQKEGVKEAASERMKERWSDPKEIEAQKERMKKITNDPVIAEKRYKGLKEYFSDPKNKDKKADNCPHKKPIIHVETGDEYRSIDDAAKKLPISRATIRNNLTGKFKSAKGYNFKYKKEETNG